MLSQKTKMKYLGCKLPTNFTLLAQESWLALTSVASWKVLTRSSIPARSTVAFIYICQ